MSSGEKRELTELAEDGRNKVSEKVMVFLLDVVSRRGGVMVSDRQQAEEKG